MQVDPSSPNILNIPFVGDNVLAKLRRPFWTELQSRYGNLFFVREQVRHVPDVFPHMAHNLNSTLQMSARPALLVLRSRQA
jgi:hypothetical protein